MPSTARPQNQPPAQPRQPSQEPVVQDDLPNTFLANHALFPVDFVLLLDSGESGENSGRARFTNGVSNRRGPEPPDDADLTLSLSFTGDVAAAAVVVVGVFTHVAPLSDVDLLTSPLAARAIRSMFLMLSMNPSALLGLEVGSFRNEFRARISALSVEISSSPRVALGPILASGCGSVVFRSDSGVSQDRYAVVGIPCLRTFIEGLWEPSIPSP